MSGFFNLAAIIFIGFASGVVVAGGVFAFIAAIGVVERLAQKTKTVSYIKIYEEAAILGGIAGCIRLIYEYKVSVGVVVPIIFCFLIGIFVGALAVSLAEVLDVMPIFMRRLRLKTGLQYFMLSLAAGKLIGALAYFLLPEF